MASNLNYSLPGIFIANLQLRNLGLPPLEASNFSSLSHKIQQIVAFNLNRLYLYESPYFQKNYLWRNVIYFEKGYCLFLNRNHPDLGIMRDPVIGGGAFRKVKQAIYFYETNRGKLEFKIIARSTSTLPYDLRILQRLHVIRDKTGLAEVLLAHPFESHKYLEEGTQIPLKKYAMFLPFYEKRDFSRISLKGLPGGLKIVLQLLQGLVSLHNEGILHGDIKPKNVFADKENRPHLGDFDFCIFFGMSFEGRGTPDYMAPEMLRAFQDKRMIKAEGALDIWSMGVTIAELSLSKNQKKKFFNFLRNFSMKDLRIPIQVRRFMRQRLNDKEIWSALLDPMLQIDPKKRITAQRALEFAQGLLSASESHVDENYSNGENEEKRSPYARRGASGKKYFEMDQR